MLSLYKINKTFNKGTSNENRLFQEFTFNIKDDDFVTIIGSNGAGKTSLLNIIAGNIVVDSGEILLNNQDITKHQEYKRAKQISRVFQDPKVGTISSMTILENLSIALNKGKNYDLTFGVKKRNIAFFKETLSKLNLGLENMLDKKVDLLSGGMRQALSLIMATITKPNLLLLDEHTAALDPNTSKLILEITENLVNSFKIPTLMITHNMNDAIKLGNRLIMLDNGKIVLDISGEEKKNLTSEKLLSLFKQLKEDINFSDRMLLI